MESTLTTQEITRVQTLQRVLDGYLTQRAAACELGLSVRHVHRLLGRLRDGGVAA
ncbi:MAG: helix-turn-helix domain-containing protein, partial [Candidatus Eremiobacteraeota bacterium]|nr:helix-turn-helix domain-containing protein [Candidatus Eremiobacteraeota bacterium]MDH2908711.1 helix-turn-helix domain-containing protein [Candidatus Eremiobacteraeota bacterium]